MPPNLLTMHDYAYAPDWYVFSRLKKTFAIIDYELRVRLLSYINHNECLDITSSSQDQQQDPPAAQTKRSLSSTRRLVYATGR